MKLKIYRRLEQLEQISVRRASGRHHAKTGASAIEAIRTLLCATGFEQEPQESLAETTARALGISCRDLRNRLSEGRLFA
jgi:hypothetical protein